MQNRIDVKVLHFSSVLVHYDYQELSSFLKTGGIALLYIYS